MTLAILWSFAAAWLSANEFISVRTELGTYGYCVWVAICAAFCIIQAIQNWRDAFALLLVSVTCVLLLGEAFACLLAVICGVFCIIKIVKGKSWKTIIRNCLSAFALLLVLGAWIFSNELFTYWKMRAVPPDAWQQMATDLMKLAKESPTTEKLQPWSSHASQLPESTKPIGLPEDYAAGHGGTDMWGESGVTVLLTYGNRARTWGLYVGTEEGARQGKYRTIPVAQNAFFYIGEND